MGWTERLLVRNLREEDFAEIMAQALGERLDRARVVRTGPLELSVEHEGGRSEVCYLANVWRSVRTSAPEERVGHVLAYLRSAKRDDSEDETPPDRASILPLVRDKAYLAEVRAATRTKGGPAPEVVAHPFIADLVVIHAVDEPHSIRLLTEEGRKALGLPFEHLEAIALDNLRRKILPLVENHGEGPVFMLTAGGTCESSLLLVDELWDGISKRLPGRLVACAPSRDVVFYTSTDLPSGVDGVRLAARRVVERGAYTISPTLLERTRTSWKLFAPARA